MTTLNPVQFQQMLQLENQKFQQINQAAKTFASTKGSIAKSISDSYGKDVSERAFKQITPEMVGQPISVERPKDNWTKNKRVFGKQYHTVSFDQIDSAQLKGTHAATPLAPVLAISSVGAPQRPVRLERQGCRGDRGGPLGFG